MESNVQVVQRGFEDFMKGNTSAVVDICTDDVTWRSYDNPNVPTAGTFKGKKGVKDFFTKLGETVDYSDFTPREYYGEGDTVIVLGHHAGKVKKTGKTHDHDWAMVFKLRDSRVYSFFSYFDSRQFAEAFQEGFDVQRKEKIPSSGVKETH
jgi:uncharacterized protein